MFFHIVLERNMQLHPRHFGRNLRENLVSKLMKDVEGTCRLRLIPHEVPVCCFQTIQRRDLRSCCYHGKQGMLFPPPPMGFFAEAGPVQIFVSNHLIPDDMEFQTGDMPNYTTSDGSVKIQKDSEVRLKIIGTRVDATEIFCIGTIKDDFLGVINDPTTA
ncbi:DNA-directed RNA polymerase II subunit RPB7 [Pyrus ussuriensis x Pyrus communis]|uniref:DNA-directed RNA polymerase subunit n=1 Tax=Pyrus ussuriensis x Pyrus communis TaxID=2448454 RepID=A0A5N5I3M8_9ROSA|nr:DNA-directed RNA polymerase II subunit RPB7 [Pyrus ussuriensis x Pyrus communis]